MAVRKRRYAVVPGKSRAPLALSELELSTLSEKNIAAVLAVRPGATHVAGFRDWLRVGRVVSKGEKAIYILAPAGLDDDGKPRFRSVPVFELAQTCELEPRAVAA